MVISFDMGKKKAKFLQILFLWRQFIALGNKSLLTQTEQWFFIKNELYD